MRKIKPLRSESQSSTAVFFKNRKVGVALALLLFDAVLTALIIAYVPYTKIDWDAYMSQVTGFLEGEKDYSQLKGDTGPLVYPAGFLYVYSAIQYVTGGEVIAAQVESTDHPHDQLVFSTAIFNVDLTFPPYWYDVSQILFGVLYIVNLAIILYIYVKADVLPWWALVLLSLSKRVHSIFVLRLFNDCFAMTLLHAAMAFILNQQWHLGLIIFSGAVSIKMNVLLYAPPLLLLMLKAMDLRGVISALAGAALVQVSGVLLRQSSQTEHCLNVQIKLNNLLSILSVNFKFVPESIFVSKQFAVSLLIIHLVLLAVFAHCRWCKFEGGLLRFLRVRVFSFAAIKNSSLKKIKEEHILTTMFVGNFIGVLFARSLHYQFYSWYFFSIPHLLWTTRFPSFVRLLLFIGVELCWNIYPSTAYSSALLLCLHLIILWGLWSAPPEYPYREEKASTQEKDK
ncbi:Dol-P-Man:Man(5)GlcNAc(2)-PP-Dol alpha-1,3-mannosyltransferase [Linum perenne]